MTFDVTIKTILRNCYKVSTSKPNTTFEDFKRKIQLIFTDIGVYWYLKMSNTKPPTKRTKLVKKEQQNKKSR